jgi:hypothetical protein
MSILDSLSGIKTYLTAGATGLGSVAALLDGKPTIAQIVMAIGIPLALMFLRSGSKADAVKAGILAAAHAADALAPVVVKLLPQTKTVTDIIEQIAAQVEAALDPTPVAVALAVAPAPVAAPGAEPAAIAVAV